MGLSSVKRMLSDKINNLRQFLNAVFLKLNPLPHMVILGSSNSAANKDMMSRIWTNGDTVI